MTKKWWPLILGGAIIIGLFLFLRLYALTNLLMRQSISAGLK